MNITKEAKDELNAVLRVSIEPTDYKEKVEKALEDYRKQVSMPGFRPGKAPAAIIRKKYFKAILLDELNKAIQQSLTDYIRTANLHILGQPLPKEDEPVKGDFDKPDNFVFAFDVGMAPTFEIGLSKDDAFDYIKLKVTDDMIEDEVLTLRRRFGTLAPSEEIGEKDLIYGDFSELEGDQLKEDGIKHSATIAMEYVNDDTAKKSLLGKKQNEFVDLDPRQVSSNETDMSAMLGISVDQASTLSSKFRFTPTEIRRMNLSELNTEFFEKLYRGAAVASEDELRNRIREDISRMYEHDTDRHLANAVTKSIMAKTRIHLPEDFLHRWFRATSENDKEASEFESKFPEYMTGLKWQLIQNRLVKENNIEIGKPEMEDFAKGMIARQYAQYGIHSPDPKMLQDHATKVLSGSKEADQIYHNVLSLKLTGLFKNIVKLNIKELPINEFTAALSVGAGAEAQMA